MAASPFIAWFYKKPELTPILLVVALNFLFSSFTIIQQTILTKEMDFKSLAIRDVAAVILAGVIGITLAYHGFGVWSLVYQLLSFTLINAILLWFLSPWRPRLQFAVSDIKDIFRFSAHLTGFNIVNYFARNIDQLLIGKVLGAEMLGYYSLAYKIVLYPLQNISWIIGRVMFPAFSKVQNDLEKVRDVFLKMVKAISLVTFPMMSGVFAMAPEFVSVIFGSKWTPVIGLLRILCFCGMFQSIGTTIGNILLSQGRVDLQFKMQIRGTLIVTCAILLGFKWGLVGVAVFYLIYSIAWVHYTLFVVCKLMQLKFSEFYRRLFPAYGVSLSILLWILALKKILMFSSLFSLVILIIAGSIFYLIFLVLNGNIRIFNRRLSLNFD